MPLPGKFPGDAHVTVIGVGRHGLILQAICNSDSWRSGQRYEQQRRYMPGPNPSTD